MSQDRLNARIRTMKVVGLVFMGLTALVCLIAFGVKGLVLHNWREAILGLLLGELGGAYVVVSLIGQGHRNDKTEGMTLYASGMVGMFTRLLALVAVMVVSELWRSLFNPYAALIGYLLGFVFIFVGLYGIARNPHNQTDS